MNFAPGIGHNVGATIVRIEVRLFNSLARPRPQGDSALALELPAGSVLGDALRRLELRPEAVFLALCNGRDVSPGPAGRDLNLEHALEDGDVLALSGPVPYSWGYGAPVV
ncbi:MAG: MoaD/ThiS family protein [Rhodospirillales bacterium]|nr:MoaD/ThiS family protein [Rhodospirillales bacterium]